MKFKANLLQPDMLSHIFQAMSKLGQTCILFLSPTKIKFLMSTEFTSGEQAFLDLNPTSIFENYLIECKNNDEIYLQVAISNFTRALHSTTSSSNVVMKLTKKRGLPFMRLLIYQTSDEISLIQDVPIELITERRLQECVEPDIPPPKVKFLLNDIKTLRNIIEKMKGLSDEINIEAKASGEVKFVIQTDIVTVQTFFKGLNFGNVSDDNEIVQARLDIRKLAKILNCTILRPLRVIGCVVEQCAFVLYVLLSESRNSLTYYVPLLAD